MNHNLSFSDRVMSGLPLSVGTSQAFETLFDAVQAPYDKDRQAPPRISLQNYQSCYINIDTLFRNLVGALDKKQYNDAQLGQFSTTIEEEIDIIAGLFQSVGGYCKPIFYHSDYDVLKKKVSRYESKVIHLREPTTDAQHRYEFHRQGVVRHLHRLSDEHVLFHGAVRPERYESSIIFTHIPYDLTAFSSFNDVVLLESNTGVVKERQDWYTKFYKHPSHPLNNIPFHEKTLLIFGDRVMLSPAKLSVRDLFLAIAERHHWTSLTTMEKLTLDISLSATDPALVAVWRML